MVFPYTIRYVSCCPAHNFFLGRPRTHTPHPALSLNSCNTSVRAGSTASWERRKHDPYLKSLSRQRKAANLSRRQVLEKERAVSLGDPVKSAPTAFIQELEAARSDWIFQEYKANEDVNLNYFVSPGELQEALDTSKSLTSPPEKSDPATRDPLAESESKEKHIEQHRVAQEAINRIISLANGNTQDRARVNFEKCIEKFGRHNTDAFLAPKPATVSNELERTSPTKTPRVGKDTGSSEVQVAILTEKILNLSRHLQTTKKDKHNKRNLRLLVHKRQKLLQYVRRKERGGPRWQYLVETLGLSDAAWKGEISM